jgi:hypothetical protein
MPSTDSFTGTAVSVSSAAGTLVFVTAASVYTPLGWYAKIDPTGVSVTKASTFGGSQGAVTFPVSRAAAVELANALLNLAN